MHGPKTCAVHSSSYTIAGLAHILRTFSCAVASISPLSYLFGEAVSDLVEELPLSTLVAEHVHRRHALAPADPAGCHGRDC